LPEAACPFPGGWGVPLFFMPNPAKPEIPKLKFQIPNKSQAPNANDPNTECADQKIFWNLGFWDLGF